MRRLEPIVRSRIVLLTFAAAVAGLVALVVTDGGTRVQRAPGQVIRGLAWSPGGLTVSFLRSVLDPDSSLLTVVGSEMRLETVERLPLYTCCLD